MNAFLILFMFHFILYYGTNKKYFLMKTMHMHIFQTLFTYTPLNKMSK